MNFITKKIAFLFLPVAASLSLASPVMAEVTEPRAKMNPPAKTKPSGAKTKKGNRPSEKEAEGTQAANRFAEDPVIKSQYRQDGKPLEVDPD